MARYIIKARRYFVHNILHADDTPSAIAMGAAIAMFVAMLPLIGFQMLIALGMAALLKANKAICIPVVWISNPLTFYPIYWPSYKLGRALLSSSQENSETAVMEDIRHLGEIANLFDPNFWKELFTFLLDLGADLWVGCLIVATIMSALMFLFTRWAVSTYREKRRQRILRRNLFRAELVTKKSNPVSETS